MANPNIVNVVSIFGNTTYLTPTVNTSVVLLPNAASSDKVFKINQIVVANTSTSSADATISIYTNGAVAQNSAPSGGTAFPVIFGIPVPSKASLIAVDKTTGMYLQEGTSIVVTSGTANALTFSVSYEEIS